MKSQIEQALDATYKSNDKEAKQNDVLVLLTSMPTEEIKQKMKRGNLETLVTIQAHQKDVLDSIVHKYKKHSAELRCYCMMKKDYVVFKLLLFICIVRNI